AFGAGDPAFEGDLLGLVALSVNGAPQAEDQSEAEQESGHDFHDCLHSGKFWIRRSKNTGSLTRPAIIRIRLQGRKQNPATNREALANSDFAVAADCEIRLSDSLRATGAWPGSRFPVVPVAGGPGAGNPIPTRRTLLRDW